MDIGEILWEGLGTGPDHSRGLTPALLADLGKRGDPKMGNLQGWREEVSRSGGQG